MRRAASQGALVFVTAVSSVVARAELPLADVDARRSSDGAAIESVAVAPADTRFPSTEARCLASRERAERRARASLHRYVDRSAGAALSPAALVRAHEAVELHALVAEVRGLVDGGSVVRVTVAVAELERATGTEMRWP